MSVYVPHTKSMQSIKSPQALVYLHFTLLAYAPQKYACHIAILHPTALIM